MSCPVCGRVMCDHTPAERGQTQEEMLRDMQRDWNDNPNPTNADKQIQKDKIKKKS